MKIGAPMTGDELYWRRSRTTNNMFLRSHDDTRSRAVVYQMPDGGTFGWKGSGHDDGQSYPTEEECISAVYRALGM